MRKPHLRRMDSSMKTVKFRRLALQHAPSSPKLSKLEELFALPYKPS